MDDQMFNELFIAINGSDESYNENRKKIEEAFELEQQDKTLEKAVTDFNTFFNRNLLKTTTIPFGSKNLSAAANFKKSAERLYELLCEWDALLDDSNKRYIRRFLAKLLCEWDALSDDSNKRYIRRFLAKLNRIRFHDEVMVSSKKLNINADPISKMRYKKKFCEQAKEYSLDALKNVADLHGVRFDDRISRGELCVLLYNEFMWIQNLPFL